MKTRILLILLSVFCTQILNGQSAKINIALLKLTNQNVEINQTLKYLKSCPDYNVQEVTANQLIADEKISTNYQVIWVHIDDSVAIANIKISDDLKRAIQKLVQNGSGLLLSNDAARLIVDFGFETNTPETRSKEASDNGYGRMLGFHAFRNHPVFTGLNGGAYILKPQRNIRVRQTGYFDDDLPAQGKVVATDWDYIFLREQKKIICEYAFGKGKVLTVGGYMLFNEPNVNRAHLELFTNNCIRYLSNNKAIVQTPSFYWNYGKRNVVCPGDYTADKSFTTSSSLKWNEKGTGIQLVKTTPGNNFWDLAGERMLVMGNENGGVEEIWAHPFMALRDLGVAVKSDGAREPVFLDSLKPEVVVRPESINRTYNTGFGRISETLVVSPTDPVAVLHYEYHGNIPAELIIQFKSNLRMMWPYSENVTEQINTFIDKENGTVNISDNSGDYNVVAGAGCMPLKIKTGWLNGYVSDSLKNEFQGVPTTNTMVSCLLVYKLMPGDCLDFVIAGGEEPIKEIEKIHRKSKIHSVDVLKESVSHIDNFLNAKLQIQTPDKEFNEAFRWAMIATDRFYVNTPGIGKSLVAGYSTSNTGWDGEHKISGRPGYAWYFGRDAEWSSLALLGYGDFEKVREVLLTFGRFQDLNGKIYHELTTSGFAHYDASDATPLYLVLAGRYLEHSGDTAFIRQIWPQIEKAYNFCVSTDTDADHLIENTNVGHGWVEGGYLFGSHTSLYLASCWAAALQNMASMAEMVNNPKLAVHCRQEEAIVKQKINNQYWNYAGGNYYHGMFKDGTFHQEPSVMPSIPMLFNQADSSKAYKVLGLLASNEYSTNWGCRIVSDKSPAFRPTGYHTGSVWPLFTGWVALAEYAYNRPESGFSHILNNLLVYKNWGLGFVEEVLNGAVYEPSGVCRHQCWSETMAIQPVIDGMLGFKPEAVNAHITLSPSLPPDWDSLEVRNLRCGTSVFNMKMKKHHGTVVYTFDLSAGPALNLDFKPFFGCKSLIDNVLSNGRNLEYKAITCDGKIQLQSKFVLTRKIVLEIQYKQGFEVLPLKYDPLPGSSPQGLRITGTGETENSFFVDVQGISGSEGVIEFIVPENFSEKPFGADLFGQTGNRIRCKVAFPLSTEKYITKRISLLQ